VSASEDYRRELVPPILPMTLWRHHVQERNISHLTGQLHLHGLPCPLPLNARPPWSTATPFIDTKRIDDIRSMSGESPVQLFAEAI